MKKEQDLYRNLITDMGKTGFLIRDLIHGVPYSERGMSVPSVLKDAYSRNADNIAEEFAVEKLTKFSQKNNDLPIRIIVNPNTPTIVDIGDVSKNRVIWSYLDVVDGTIKVAGLGSENNIYRIGNDGLWGSGFAFTTLTEKKLEELTIGDFTNSIITDGNPSKYHHSPTNAFSISTNNKETFELLEDYNCIQHEIGSLIRLTTSSQTNIGQGAILFDGFQGFDRNTASSNAEELNYAIYKTISNRNEGGAFDVWRSYGTLCEIMRGMLWYGEKGLEAQGVAAIRMNDHLANAIPPYAIFTNAGGFITDFDGNDLGKSLITAGRPNSIYSANEIVKDYLVDKMQEVTKLVG